MVRTLIVGLIALGSLGFAADSVIKNAAGTWKMNEAKSHFDKGQEEKDYTIVVSIANGIATIAVDGMGGFYGPDKRMTFKMTVPVQGGPMTYIENGPGPELDIHDVWKVIDDHASELTSTMHGKVIGAERITFSPRTMIIKGTNTDPQTGQQHKSVEYYEKQ